MADSTIDSELFNLTNNWGSPGPNEPNLLDGITGESHHNVAAPFFPVGTVVQRCNRDGIAGKPGLSEFVYLQVGTQNPDVAIAAKSVVVQDSATVWYQVTNDPDDLIKLPTGLAAIALSAMTDAYYGFFWCGGVCPEAEVSGMGGNYATDDNVAAGPITAHDLDADAIGLGPSSDATGSLNEGTFGWAVAADA